MFRWHDPFVHDFSPAGNALPRVQDPVAAAADADVVVLLQAHTSYDLAALTEAAVLLLDTRGMTRGANVERL